MNSATKNWDITVINPLPEDITDSEIILTLTATETDNANEGTSILIVTLNSSGSNEDVVEFSQTHYSASYSSDDKLSVDDEIKIITKDITNVAITLQGKCK